MRQENKQMSGLRLDEKGVIIPCPQCGQQNRTPYARLGDTGTCGRCQNEIRPPGVPIDVANAAQFDALIGLASLPVVIDFWAPWCGPCKAVAPELVKVAASNAGQFLIAKVDTQSLPALGGRFGVQSIPTMAVFQNGQEVTRTMGARPAAAIESFVRQAIGG